MTVEILIEETPPAIELTDELPVELTLEIEAGDEVVLEQIGGTDLWLEQTVTEVVVELGSIPEIVLEMNEPGPPGPPGPPGAAETRPAGATVSGHRVVSVQADGSVVHANAGDDSAKLVIGFSTNAALLGEAVGVLVAGSLTWPAGSLTPGAPLFLAADGLVTDVAPTSGWLRWVATAAAADRIVVSIEQAYWLG